MADDEFFAPQEGQLTIEGFFSAIAPRLDEPAEAGKSPDEAPEQRVEVGLAPTADSGAKGASDVAQLLDLGVAGVEPRPERLERLGHGRKTA